MQKIQLLPISEIQKIAAGQVVERPVNVVKELVENALDAGATKISIFCKNAGQSLIRIVDNGCGMSSVDAQLCFERHATSKVRSFDELSSLQTFGFRGEALYTIGAVSNVTILTKEEGAHEGAQVIFNQGVLQSSHASSCSVGTDISVHDLFCNVPARKKFLKKEETEWRLIVQLFQAFCFAYKQVHFQLYSENTLVYNCPPVNSLIDRSAQIWDLSLARTMLSVDTNEPLVSEAIISDQHLVRYNRNCIFFFVNKRWVTNYCLMQSLMKGYSNILPAARYPVAIVSLTVDPAFIDSNIHPRKEEVAFVNQKQIEHALTKSVVQTLEKKVTVALVSTQQKQSYSLSRYDVNTRDRIPTGYDYSRMSNETQVPLYVPIERLFEKSTQDDVLPAQRPLAFESIDTEKKIAENGTAEVQDSLNEESFEIIGVLKKTYILVEHEDGLLMVDQHAAHERILFERYAGRFHEVASTALLFPEMVYLSNSDMKLVIDHAVLLQEYGIIVDQKGENQLCISSIPVHLKSVVWSEFIREVVDLFTEYSHLQKDEFFTQVNTKIQAQMACKAAVKAGDTLTQEQMIQLLKDLSKTKNRFSCPHGRPTSWILPHEEIEKKFRRRK
jgi:DNA mismatch repair protein MutL